MDISSSLISTLTHSGASNPLIAGAFSVWLLGLTTYLLRSLPTKLHKFIMSRFTVSVTINANGAGNEAIIQSFTKWYCESGYMRNSRRFFLESLAFSRNITSEAVTSKRILGPGFGTHWFFFEGRFGWFTRKTGASTESTVSSQEIQISFLGQNIATIENFVENIKLKRKEDQIVIYGQSASRLRNEWSVIKVKQKRTIKSVIIANDTKDKILKDIEYFYKNIDWYVSRGITHKLTYLFYGAPGTGKSSLIFALASYFDKPIYMVNIAGFDDSTFQAAMSQIPENAFIVFEDMDVSTATEKREPEEGIIEVKPKVRSTLSMSVLLNTLDGIASLNGNTVFITTNHIDQLDPALTRRGRVDHIVEILPMQDHEIREYITLMYPDAVLDATVVYEPIVGCDIQAFFLEHKEDQTAFLNELKITTKDI